MMKLLPILMLLIGTGAGVGAGVFLRPAPTPEEMAEKAEGETEEKAEVEQKGEKKDEKKDGESAVSGKEYVRLTNQFVVPIVSEDRVDSMVVMSLSVEVPYGREQDVLDLEPKIRDVYLRILFDHAAVGGFSGAFARNENLDIIRRNLVNASLINFGNEFISDVLIFEIARQDY